MNLGQAVDFHPSASPQAFQPRPAHAPTCKERSLDFQAAAPLTTHASRPTQTTIDLERGFLLQLTEMQIFTTNTIKLTRSNCLNNGGHEKESQPLYYAARLSGRYAIGITTVVSTPIAM